MRVLTVVGARPQFVKAAPVSDALGAARIEQVLVHTGQHFDPEMSSVFFDELAIPEPDINLNINSGSHGEMTGRMTEALERVLVDVEPDWVLVYGDTNSTLAAAIATSKLPDIRLAHVEAGLRSFNRQMPEEVNRVVTDHLSHRCLTPTVVADENLAAEGINGDRVVRTGDVMFDAVLRFSAIADERSTVLADHKLSAGEFVLATVHRAENTDEPGRLRDIVEALVALSHDVPVVLPLHPRTAKAVDASGLDLRGVLVVPPVGYLDMLLLERGAKVVVTDSGGVQKEAFFQQRPCVTLRTETEWTELVELGWNRLAAPNEGRAALVERLRAAIDSGGGKPASPYGEGDASGRVVDELLRG